MLARLANLLNFRKKPVGYLDGHEVKLLAIIPDTENADHYFFRIEATKDILNELNQTMGVRPVPIKVSVEGQGELSSQIEFVKKYATAATNLEEQMYNSHYIIKEII